MEALIVAAVVFGLYVIAYAVGWVIGIIRAKFLLPKGDSLLALLSKVNELMENGAGYRDLIDFLQRNGIPEDLANGLIEVSESARMLDENRVKEIVAMLAAGSDAHSLVSHLESQGIDRNIGEAVVQGVIRLGRSATPPALS